MNVFIENLKTNDGVQIGYSKPEYFNFERYVKSFSNFNEYDPYYGEQPNLHCTNEDVALIILSEPAFTDKVNDKFKLLVEQCDKGYKVYAIGHERSLNLAKDKYFPNKELKII